MKSTHVLIAVSFLSLVTSAVIANAQTKLTREQAWGACMKAVDASTPKTDRNDAERTAAFKACMAKMGYPAG